jgi:hypothetical protein
LMHFKQRLGQLSGEPQVLNLVKQLHGKKIIGSRKFDRIHRIYKMNHYSCKFC